MPGGWSEIEWGQGDCEGLVCQFSLSKFYSSVPSNSDSFIIPEVPVELGDPPVISGRLRKGRRFPCASGSVPKSGLKGSRAWQARQRVRQERVAKVLFRQQVELTNTFDKLEVLIA